MIDLHCHLLPGIDDGPPTVEAALALAQALVADGVTQVVATPHVFPGRFENRRSSIEDEHAAFAEVLHRTGLPLTLLLGGEVRLTPEALDLLARDELPFLGQGPDGYRTLLLEMPDGQVPVGAVNFVRHLMAARVRPLIAHPERNRGVMDHLERLEPLLDEGCLVQVTAASVVGHFGPRAQAVTQEMLELGWVNVVASDAHNLTGRRPRLGEAAAWLRTHFGAELAHELTVAGPARLCAGNPAAQGALCAPGRVAPGAAPATAFPAGHPA